MQHSRERQSLESAKGSQFIYPLLSHWASGKEVSRHTDWKIIQIITFKVIN